MSCLLHIETSAGTCSVALSEDGGVVFERSESQTPSPHATLLAPMVEEALSMADSHAIPLDGVAVSSGPGSYTGLRIGVSLAKGVAYSRKAKLIAVPTLRVLATPVLLYDDLPDEALLCPMIDARRLEVYTAVFARDLSEVVPTRAMVVEEGCFAELLAQRPVFFFGDGAEKCRSILRHPNAVFLSHRSVALAKHMVPLAELALAKGEVQDVAYFEPFYLKDFVATHSSKNLLATPVGSGRAAHSQPPK